MNTAIIGAGAMGSLFGARLAEAGVEVTLIDTDAAHVAAIQKEGLRFEDDDGERAIPIQAHLPSDVNSSFDLMIFFTKAAHTEAAARPALSWRTDATWLLTLQNGLGGADRLAALAPPERIAVGVTNLPSDKTGPGQIRSHGEGAVWLGAAQGAPGDGVTKIADLLGLARIACQIDLDIQTRIWEKAAFNCAINTLAAIGDQPVGGVADSPHDRILARRVVDEVGAVCKAAGSPFDNERVALALEHAYRNHRSHLPSMVQDLRAGRQTEIGALNNAVRDAGARLGVPVPVTQALASLIEALEQQS